ncbi:MAG: crotonyl-CoA carboxylase/reductase, partial [Tepidiformaceae bacterium]
MTAGTAALPIGQLPPLGEVPARMFAQVIRQGRLGEPRDAFQVEEVDVPDIGPDEVLVAVMAAGINYNNVWAAMGMPIDIIAIRQAGGDTRDYHIGGSDASGIVYRAGGEVTNVKVGDEVVVHPGVWDRNDPWVQSGRDPMVAPSAKIWGYDTNNGSFAQFTVAQAHQCLPKAPHLTWEEAAAPTLVGTTAYRMLFGWPPNVLQEGDVVLVWGGSGGLGSQAIQLAAHVGAKAVAVVSSEERGEYCKALGAVGYINRTEFDHWGLPPHWDDVAGQSEWTKGVRAFGKKFWEALGERRNPSIVYEHPGEDTVPTSMFVCEQGGMVVICAGSTGYSAMVDLRYLWVRQKRFQGSHGSNDEQARAYNDLVHQRIIDPCMGRVLRFEDVGRAHQDMKDGTAAHGNTAILVG